MPALGDTETSHPRPPLKMESSKYYLFPVLLHHLETRFLFYFIILYCYIIIYIYAKSLPLYVCIPTHCFTYSSFKILFYEIRRDHKDLHWLSGTVCFYVPNIKDWDKFINQKKQSDWMNYIASKSAEHYTTQLL